MSAEPSEREPNNGNISFVYHDFVELEPLDYQPPPPTAGESKSFTVVMLEPIVLDDSNVIPIGPPMALRLTAQFAADAEPVGSQREFVDLLEALDDLDRALGGNGLVLDASLSGGSKDTLTVVLNPRNARWSLDRFTQAAELLVGGPAARTGEQPPIDLNGEHVAAVTSLFEHRGPINKESARDRVQNWRGRQKWMASLQVELVPAKAG